MNCILNYKKNDISKLDQFELLDINKSNDLKVFTDLDRFEIEFIKKYSYGFMIMTTFSINIYNKKIKNMIYEEFGSAVFEESSLLKQKIDLFNKMSLIEKLDSSKNKVLTWIISNYNISTDISKRIKISDLLDAFNHNNNNTLIYDKGATLDYLETVHSVDTLNSLKKQQEEIVKITINQLSTYLIELGLIKKRYSDGIYYYGLELKNKNFKHEYKESYINIDNMFEDTMDKQKDNR